MAFCVSTTVSHRISVGLQRNVTLTLKFEEAPDSQLTACAPAWRFRSLPTSSSHYRNGCTSPFNRAPRNRHVRTSTLGRVDDQSLRGLWCPFPPRTRCFHLFQAHNFVTNSVRDPQPSNLDVPRLPDARSGAHSHCCRGIRLDLEAAVSSHVFVHVLCDYPSC